MRGDYERSAGCAIFREDPALGTCVLLLRSYSKFDLPKGHIEKGDKSPFETAVRESFEECGFTVINNPEVELDAAIPAARTLRGGNKPIECLNVNLKTGSIKKVVYLFPVETLCASVTILPNAKSGIMEHQGFKWEPIESIKDSGLHRYLIQGVMDAYSVYRASLAVNEALLKFR